MFLRHFKDQDLRWRVFFWQAASNRRIEELAPSGLSGVTIKLVAAATYATYSMFMNLSGRNQTASAIWQNTV